MMSGIGDREELAAHGIATLVHAPDVGKHMQDHPWVPLQWRVNTNDTLDTINRNPDLFNAAMEVYNATKQGVMANNPGGNQIGWFRLPRNSSVLKEFGDPSAGPSSPHFELTFGVGRLIRVASILTISLTSASFFHRIPSSPSRSLRPPPAAS